MKNLLSKILLLSTVLLVFPPSCKKDKGDNSSSYTHRIVSSNDYENDQLRWQGTFQYSGDKLINASSESVDGYWSEEYLFSYPDNTSVKIDYSETYDSEVYEESIFITLENNRVIEILEVDGYDYKSSLSYNSDGTVASVHGIINVDGSWEPDFDVTYTYSSGKLMEILYFEYGGSDQKWEFSYNGNGIDIVISFGRENGGLWIEDTKDVYSYNGGVLNSVTEYVKTEGSIWQEKESVDYVFDSFGDLLEETWHEGDFSYSIENTYEEGIGNYHQIFEFLWRELVFYEPIPNKKSQNREGNLLKPHHFISGNSFFNLAH